MVDAAKSGDGKKLAEQLYRFVSTTKAHVTDKAENKSIAGADDYTTCVGTCTTLLFIVNPEIGDGVLALDAGSRGKLFDDAAETSIGKSSEIQKKTEGLKDKLEAMRMSDQAKYWSSATSCAMQLQQTVG